MKVVGTPVVATWQVQDPDRHRLQGSHFVRLTGPDGVPGLNGPGGITVWSADIATGGVPDLTGLTKIAPDGTDLVPKQGDWVLTRENGDLKLWPLGAGASVGTAIDLPDGPAGPPGDPATAQHTHTYAMATNSYALIRDRYVGSDVTVSDTLVVR